MAEVIERLDSKKAWRWAVATRAALNSSADSLDSLNVFPIPDRDTGSNLRFTFHAALCSLERSASIKEAPLSIVTDALASASALNARGNSGVILSQMLRGLAEVLAENPQYDEEDLDAKGLALALARMAEHARQGVASPVEGTVLTVADAAAEGALSCARIGGSFNQVVAAALTAAECALQETPRTLPVLDQAGVVDAGGAGYVLMLRVLAETVTGGKAGQRRSDTEQNWKVASRTMTRDTHRTERPQGAGAATGASGNSAVHSREVMFTLPHIGLERRNLLCKELETVGDSVAVTGGANFTTVHIHTCEPGAALELARRHGTPQQVRVTDLHTGSKLLVVASEHTSRAVLTGSGLEVADPAVMKRSVVEEGLPADPEDTVVLIVDTTAQKVDSSPPDDDPRRFILTTGCVISTLAAASVYDSGRPGAENIRTMSLAARGCRTGLIQPSVNSETGGPATWVAVVEDEVVLGTHGETDAVLALTRFLLSPDSEILTLVIGAAADLGRCNSRAGLVALLKEQYPGVELRCLSSEAEEYAFLIGVE
ncbi:DAK2 domain-containing protein [Austwickia chelonae]|uniref:DAK2 domain-containing protein n=1 Tax=Austwickia chelonae TaxID=100225 RepID=UPI000E25C917|nr:DAK2 domain-containing protein [Austwickia chelonae]